MISSVANNAGIYSGLRSEPAPKSRTNFGEIVQTASTAAGNTVLISQNAKAMSASTQAFDFDFSYNNIDNSQDEFKAHYAQGARQISEMQGLPEGQFDFTKISRKQAQVILNDMILNRGVPIGKETVGLENYISSNVDLSGNSIGSDMPQNAIENIKMQQVSFPDARGGKFGVPEESLKWILSITKTAGVLNQDNLLYAPSNSK